MQTWPTPGVDQGALVLVKNAGNDESGCFTADVLAPEFGVTTRTYLMGDEQVQVVQPGDVGTLTNNRCIVSALGHTWSCDNRVVLLSNWQYSSISGDAGIGLTLRYRQKNFIF